MNNTKKLELGLFDDNIDSDINFNELVEENNVSENIVEQNTTRFNFLNSNNEPTSDLTNNKTNKPKPLFDNLGDFDFDDEIKIKIFGVGGAGNNMVNHIANNTDIKKECLFAINTDYQVLKTMSKEINLILIGRKITKGLGSGSNPIVGLEAAQEDEAILRQSLEGTDLLFIIGGMGKGTGTGASPYITQIAKEMGILVLSLVNLPSKTNEGKTIFEKGHNGLNELKKYADGVLTISNEKLLKATDGNITLYDSFTYANNVISDVIYELINMVTIPTQINVDFNDVKNFFNQQTEFQVNSFSFSSDEDMKEQFLKKLKNEIYQDNIEGAQKILVNFKLNPSVPNKVINVMRTVIEDVTGNSDIEMTYSINYNDLIPFANISIVVAVGNKDSINVQNELLEVINTKTKDLEDQEDNSHKFLDMTSPLQIKNIDNSETLDQNIVNNKNNEDMIKVNNISINEFEELKREYENIKEESNKITSNSFSKDTEHNFADNEPITNTGLNRIISKTLRLFPFQTKTIKDN